jgi:ATP-dependent RNA helicase SUPV3L1/SUV3
MKNDEAIVGLARGVAFRLVESLGVIPRSVISNDVKSLDQDARSLLRKHGVRFGQFTIFQHLMLKPAPTRLRLVLWSLKEGLNEFPEAPPAGLVTIPSVEGAPKGYYPRAGYRLAGERAIRIDMLERLADMLRAVDTRGGFEASADMLSITGMTLEQFADLMSGLGYSGERDERVKVKALVEVKPEVESEAKVDGVSPATAKEITPLVPMERTEGAIAEEAGPEMEVFYTFRWVPKKRPSDQGRSQRPQAKVKKLPRGSKPKLHTPKLAPTKDKKLDPDNPFAALMALKGKS